MLLQWAGRATARGPCLCNSCVHVFCWIFLTLTAGWRWKSSSPPLSLLTRTYPYLIDSFCKSRSLAHLCLYTALCKVGSPSLNIKLFFQPYLQPGSGRSKTWTHFSSAHAFAPWFHGCSWLSSQLPTLTRVPHQREGLLTSCRVSPWPCALSKFGGDLSLSKGHFNKFKVMWKANGQTVLTTGEVYARELETGPKPASCPLSHPSQLV